MNKSILWGAIILIALFAFLIWGGFLQLPNKSIEVSKAIPANAIAVFQMNDYPQVFQKIKQAAYYIDLNKMDWVEAITDATELLNQLSKEKDGLNEYAKVITSLHLNTNSEIELLHILPSTKYGDKPFRFFRKAFINEKDKIEPRTYKGETIYRAQTAVNNFSNIAFAECDGLILFSKSVNLVEKSISALKEPLSKPYLKVKPHKLAGKTPQIGILINSENFTTAQKEFQKGKNTALLNWLEENTIQFNGDIFATSNKLVINGQFNHDDLFYKTLAANASKNDFKLKAFIPESITGFRWYGVNNFYTFLETYLEQEDVEQADWLLNLSEGLGNEWLINWHNSDATDITYIFAVSDIEKVGIAIDADFNEQASTKIKPLKQTALLNFVASQPEIEQNKAASLHYTFHADYLIIGTSKKLLEKTITELKTGKTIYQTQHFIDFESNLIANAVSVVYLKNNELNTWLNQQLSYLNNAKQAVLQKFDPVILQFYPTNKGLFLHGTLAYEGKGLSEKINFDFEPPKPKPMFKKFFDEKPKDTKWQKLVGEKIINGPHNFLNHYTGLNESLVQDANHTLYLVNKKDSILWKKKLDGAILGGIHSIDYYQNNKLQILLNTPHSIYLIDRKGRDVDNFPVKFDQHASNPLSLIHYKDLNKMRYFVVGEKGKLMAFNKDGSVLQGWNFKDPVGEVELPLLHFISAKKDYLCIVNKKGGVMETNI